MKAGKEGMLEIVRSDGKASSRKANGSSNAGVPDTTQLARLMAAYAPHDGSFEMRVPGVLVSRISRVNKECVHALRISSLCIVAQGAKTVIAATKSTNTIPRK